MFSFKQFLLEQQGHFFVSAIVPVNDSPRRMEGEVHVPENTNRNKVLGIFISRYTDKIGLYVFKNRTTSTVRWVKAPTLPPKLTQQEFRF